MISIEQATVYRSSLRGRRYFSKGAAIKAEARSLIKDRYPTEESESDDRGQMTYAGFHWTDLKHSEKLYRRVCRLITNKTAYAGTVR